MAWCGAKRPGGFHIFYFLSATLISKVVRLTTSKASRAINASRLAYIHILIINLYIYSLISFNMHELFSFNIS